MNKLMITNIQRFSLHDGPGIRTTIFLKGCFIRCPWCANPENLSSIKQKYVNNGVEGIYGKEYSCDEVFEEVIKDQFFYEGNINEYAIDSSEDLEKLPGGVTFSGGECLLQIDKMVPLLEQLKKEGIHMTVETSLFVSEVDVSIALQYIDLFYVDIKILDSVLCKSILKGNLDLYLSNLKRLLSSGKPIVFRIPVIGGYTDTCENRKKIIELIKKSKGNVLKIEIIKEHSLGESKYRSLINGENDIALPKYRGVTDDFMEQYKKELIDEVDIPVEICKI